MALLAVSFSYLQIGLLVAAAIVGALLAAGIFGKKFGPVAKELQEALQVHSDAKRADSPGGRDITPEEQNRIYKERMDVLQKTWVQYRGTFMGWFTKIFTRE